jgi:hypothetical protein
MDGTAVWAPLFYVLRYVFNKVSGQLSYAIILPLGFQNAGEKCGVALANSSILHNYVSWKKAKIYSLCIFLNAGQVSRPKRLTENGREDVKGLRYAGVVLRKQLGIEGGACELRRATKKMQSRVYYIIYGNPRISST